MSIFIEIIEGADVGARFKVEEGLTIGRSKADIIITDPKVSGTHAQFMLDGKGQYALTDLGSSNGLHINGRRVKKVALLPGVIFEVGRTQFKVVAEEKPVPEAPRPLTWRGVLREGLGSLEWSGGDSPADVQRFTPALKLTFIQGIQADQEIILGYGPRLAGSDSLDIELLDEKAPAKAFELHPGPGMVELKILAPGKVTLNNKSPDAEMLKDGDLISIGNSLIKATYL